MGLTQDHLRNCQPQLGSFPKERTSEQKSKESKGASTAIWEKMILGRGIASAKAEGEMAQDEVRQVALDLLL